MKFRITFTMEQHKSPSPPTLRDVQVWARRIKKLTEGWTGVKLDIQAIEEEK